MRSGHPIQTPVTKVPKKTPGSEMKNANQRRQPPIAECLWSSWFPDNIFGQRPPGVTIIPSQPFNYQGLLRASLWALLALLCACDAFFQSISNGLVPRALESRQIPYEQGLIKPETGWNVDVALWTNGGTPIHNTRLRKRCHLTTR